VIGRIVIADVLPVVSCGQWPAKAVVGEVVPVSATVFREGHDRVGANVVMIPPDGHIGSFVRMRQGGPDAPDRFEAEVVVDAQGTWQLRIEAWADPVATWQHAVSVKAEAGQQLPEMVVDLEDGALLLDRAAQGLPAEHRPAALHAVAALRDARLTDVVDRIAPALSPALTQALAATPLRELLTTGETYPLTVDRRAALFSSWYELFPRSEGASLDPPRSGTFRTAAERLPAVRDMGFDVVYLPPIHPIGEVNRKGPNNTLAPGPDDPGSPWAIGSREGGHDAVHPGLGTIDDFDAFVARAGELGMEVALDLAMQCAPDHPWATEHPEWFTTKSDGSIAYAENPPKKYQDIYPLNFDNDPEGIYAEILRVVRHWTAHGVHLFRVDNPHTKPVQFWERLIAEIKQDEPDVLFLAEAFTRAPMMHTLGRVGFTQSYTYFTWRTAKWELEEYGRELVDAAWHMRPNFFVNTPDILHGYLQYGGPPAFKIRAVLASMLSPAWGVYAGYEKYEHVAVRPGSEEYLDSEKYQYRPRDWSDAPLAGYLGLLNDVRRRHPALQSLRALRFHHADQEQLLVFSKRVVQAGATHTGGQLANTQQADTQQADTVQADTVQADTGQADTVLVVVNLDPHAVREATLWLDLPQLGVAWDETFDVVDEVTGAEYAWGQSNYVRLDPFVEPAHIFSVRPRKAGP